MRQIDIVTVEDAVQYLRGVTSISREHLQQIFLTVGLEHSKRLLDLIEELEIERTGDRAI